ncbi:MAG: SDR family NAD(P)-dependent oxidoreductase [Firmicutes bacterium]|nr:SDR family NAD(P)-dependent oxidoreductase [Bacillota bacterium]
MKTVTTYIYNQVAAKLLSQEKAKEMLRELQAKTGPPFPSEIPEKEIAIIGVSGKFPKAANLDQYWENIAGGVECIGYFPENRRQECEDFCARSKYVQFLTGIEPTPNPGPDNPYVKGGYLEEIDKFDAAFFRIPPREAKFMDPLQRVFLETAYEALEDSGYGAGKLSGKKVGVYVGKDHTTSTMYKYVTEPDQMHLTGSWAGILASRIAYIYNFKGPCLVIDTACSSGLVAIHEACLALRNQECELAIAGGIQVQIFPVKKNPYGVMGMVESSDEKVRAFDKDANGTVWGEGVGAVILKPLSKAIADGDQIYAVIKSSAINNDGAASGISAPNAGAQKEVIIQAWRDAGIDPETISYIEAHGTGTALGDPIEIKGITSAFREFTAKQQFCAIGSVKANVGHLVAAAGLASVIKVILALQKKLIPPSINFNAPNPYISFIDSPVYLNDRLRPWESKGAPRRAGVSAFGFSGTNCHLILEEAPLVEEALAGLKRETAVRETRLWLFTISARKMDILREMVSRYHNYLNRETGLELENLCYTATTCRGHYGCRIAFAVTSLAGLREKLGILQTTPWDGLAAQGIYIGAHKNTASREYKTGGEDQSIWQAKELDAGEKRRLNILAREKLRELLAAADISAALAPGAALCQLYVQGADIDWSRFFENQKAQKIRLPVYPLERVKCWAGPNMSQIEGLRASSPPVLHPLLHHLLADAPDFRIYQTSFKVESHWVLQEHQVLGHNVAPGVIYLEMARAAAQDYFETGYPLELQDFLFSVPLAVKPGEAKEVRTILRQYGPGLEFMAASKTVDSLGHEQWSVHAQGKIARLRPQEMPSYNLKELTEGLDRAGAVHHPVMETENGFTLGPRWKNISRIIALGNQALLYFQLPEAYQSDLQAYRIHPALMDHAVNALSQSIAGMYLPLMYKKLRIYGPMPPSFYSYLKRKESATGSLETITLDAWLMDEEGRVFAEVEDYSLKKVQQTELQFTRPSGVGQAYYGFQWVPAPDPEGEAQGDNNGRILVFKDQGGTAGEIIKLLREQGQQPVEIDIGPAYRKLSQTHYIIKNQAEDYQRLISEFHGQKIWKIIHMISLGQAQPPDTAGGDGAAGQHNAVLTELPKLETSLSLGVHSLFFLTQALNGHNNPEPIDLVLIAANVNDVNGSEPWLNPVPASLFGLGRVVPQENPQIRCRAIDLDFQTSLSRIMAEIFAKGLIYQAAYRQGQRFVEEFRWIEIPAGVEPPIKEDGVYLITGGAGGIGLEIARYLASKARVKLALLNRNPLLKQRLMDGVNDHGGDERLKAQTAAIRALQAGGSEILILSADVSDEAGLAAALNEARQKFGPINGVIHAAGVAGAGVIAKKDPATWEKVMAPKVQGTWLLDRLTLNDPLDFFILFSSIATLTGGAGQSDYTAANSFLDCFAAWRNRKGRATVAINWPLWKEVGMAAAYQVTDENLTFKGLTVANALNHFGRILAAAAAKEAPSRVIPGELNLKITGAAFQEGQLPFQLSSRIKTALEKQRAIGAGPPPQPERSRKQKAKVIGSMNPEEEETVSILAQIWAGVLGMEEIDIHQSFYDMGGDSILAGQLFAEINREYPGLLNIADIFSYTTVHEMAGLLREKGGPELRRNLASAREATGVQTPLEPEAHTPAHSEKTPLPGEATPPAFLGAGPPKPAAKSFEISEGAGPSSRLKDEAPQRAPLEPPEPTSPPGLYPHIYRVEDKWPEVKLFQRDEPGAKELRLVLQREITTSLHRCLPLQVILSDELLHPWFYEHFVNIFSQIQGDGIIKLDFLEEWAPYRAAINEISLGARYLAQYPDIIPFIIDNINQGHYLNVSVDEYYLPRKMRFGKTHFIHHALIYGYDNHKQELKIVGFNAGNVIDRIVYTYDEFREAYEKGKEFYPESAPWAYRTAVQIFYSNGFDRPYPFNINKFLHKLYNYLHSVPEPDIIYYWSLREDQVEYGFKVYDAVLERMDAILRGVVRMDYRATHLLYEHKNAIVKRLAYIIGRYGITGRLIDLYEAYLKVAEQFKTVRLRYYELENRFTYRDIEPGEMEAGKAQIEQLMAIISAAREEEKELLTEVYEILKPMNLG